MLLVHEIHTLSYTHCHTQISLHCGTYIHANTFSLLLDLLCFCCTYLILVVVTTGCKQVSFIRELQLSEGSSGWSAVYPHLQTQEDMEGGVFKEKKVSAISLSHPYTWPFIATMWDLCVRIWCRGRKCVLYVNSAVSY